VEALAVGGDRMSEKKTSLSVTRNALLDLRELRIALSRRWNRPVDLEEALRTAVKKYLEGMREDA